ncbi:MAG: carboxymuconolactone decarboxylase family protein [Planctomycetota bacterium]
MKAHEADLRAEVERERRRRPAADDEPRGAESFAADVAAQGSEAAHTDRLRALLQYAERLTLQPGSVEPVHIEALHEAGLDDRAIHDAAQAVAYFAYINRVADGLGVDLEPDMT